MNAFPVFSDSARGAVYVLLTVVACAAATGRIMNVESPAKDKTTHRGRTPFLSANDRSRWSAIRALVDEGTFELDKVILNQRGNRNGDWYSIDLVRHRGWDGKQHYYSSKPTLLTVLLAGEYWLVQQVTGLKIAEQPFYVGRIMLVITNVIPLAFYLLVLARIVERYGRTDAGRIFVFVAAAFGTFITTFAVTLNNHTLAAATALLAIHAVLHIWREPTAGYGWYAWAGLNAALTVSNELPALALLVMLAAALFVWKSPVKTIVGFGIPAALVAAAALGTNYYAHGSWKTPYAHRKDGKVIASFASDAPAKQLEDLAEGRLPEVLVQSLWNAGIELPNDAKLTAKDEGRRWMLWLPAQERRFAVVFRPEVGLEVREWDNWYDYEGSYWSATGEKGPQGVDRGEESRLVYAIHCLFGHHGLFSLTPIWLFSVAGCWLLWRRQESELRGLAVLVVVLTLVVLAFYIVQRPLADRNYGGVSTGLRWMFWFIPLWLITMLPAADALTRSRWRQALAVALLAVSVFSAHYNSLNPWQHPWLFDFWEYLGYIEYP
jgi:hypothetical protein